MKKITSLFLFFALLLSGTAFAQTVSNNNLTCVIPPGDKDPCTSNDLQIVGIAINAPACTSCTPGQTVTYPLKMTIHNGTNSERTSFALYGSLSSGASINGFSGNIFVCVGPITVKSNQTLAGETAAGNQTFAAGTITFTCGQNLTLSNNYLAWTDAAGNTADRCNTFKNATSCASIAPKCGQAASITIKGPVVPPTLGGADPTCTVTTGSITLTPTTGSTYKFDGGNYVAYPSGGWTGLAAGSTHTVSEKRSDGCTSPNASRTIGAAKIGPVVPTLGGAEPTCTVTTGSITLTPTTGSTYKFDGGNYVAYPSGGWTGLAANSTHTVSEKNSEGCTSPNASRTIARTLAEPVAPTLGGAEPTCTVTTGSITLTPTTGSTYKFDGGNYVAYPSGGWTGLAANSTHTVSEKNSDGCTSPNATRTIAGTLAVPGAPTSQVVLPLCTDPTMTVQITNFNSALSYSLTQPGNNIPFTPDGTGKFAGLAFGAGYTIIAKNPSTNCSSGADICGGGNSLQRSSTVSQASEPQTSVKAYPNPFNDKVKFVITAAKAGNGSLEIYNTMGQKIKTVFQGHLSAGVNDFELKLPNQKSSNLIYRFVMDQKRLTGKLLQLNQ